MVSIPMPPIQEMPVDVPECFVFTIENSKITSGASISAYKKLSSTTTLDTVKPKRSIKSFFKSRSQKNSAEDKKLHDRCCFGLVNILVLLQLTALLNFLLDAVCTYLALESIASYLFALSAIGSLLCLCAVISASQEEKYKMLSSTTIWTSLKLLVVGILYVTATASLVEFYFSDDTFTLSLELTVLFAIIPMCLLIDIIQWKLTKKAVQLIQARDEFYVIPSARGSVQMRASLRLYLAAKRLSMLQNV